ncbi:HIT-like protein [Rickenella mellea]|uniref:HIT-like protein n=1 Tax=Rickenella mellea TaxID=50990 RepID=A0A4Y7QB31_9AGAM|nr:HIT-like protein [Rickenella mellea]
MAKNMAIFRTWAQKQPSSLSPDILLTHTDTSMTVFDAYPKSIFHVLVLPRILPPLTITNSSDLKTLLREDKKLAKDCIQNLADDAAKVKGMIEDEMVKRFGFKWPIWMGFHAVPSMVHLHLHILSADLCSPSMKNKKHYNSFHPKVGFFLHLDEVLSWFDAEPSYYKTMTKLDKTQYEPKLKEPLECFHCGKELKNIPLLKSHLQDEWDKVAARAKKAIPQTKRARDEETGEDEPARKKQESTAE